MVYVDGIFCFLHVSRSGGSSIEKLAASSYDHGAAIISNSFSHCKIHRHCKAYECAMYIEDFDKVWKWAIARNIWEIIDSAYRLFFKNRKIKKDCSVIDFVNIAYNNTIEMFSSYDLNGSYNIEPIPFTSIKNKDKKVLNYLSKKSGMDFYQLPHISSSKDSKCTVPWTEDAIEFVRDRGKYDIERFNYTVPKEIYNVIKP